MSIEQSIADLTTQAQNLLQLPSQLTTVAQQQIAAVGTAYENRIAAMKVQAYVNQATGDDANPGTAALPVKTIQRAVAMTPPGGICEAILQAPYDWSADVTLQNKVLKVKSATSTRHLISFSAYLLTIATTNYRALRGLNVYDRSSIIFDGVGLFMPDLSAVVGGASSALIGTGMITRLGDASLNSMQIVNCDVIMTGTPWGGITSFEGNLPMHYHEQSVVLSGGAASLNGRRTYTGFGGAGLAVSSYPQIVSNLATL